MRIVTLAVTALIVSVTPARARAQASAGAYSVLINGAPAGSASAVANLPTDAVVLHQDSTSALPSKQVSSSEQTSVVLTTMDPALVSAIQTWMKADNSGFKDTVQRKTVEIDRTAGSGPNNRYQLQDAWPSKLESADGTTTITIVYQRLAPVVP
jgi:hypothetical protein